MGGESEKPQTVTQTNTVQMSPEQRKFYNLAFPFIKDYASKPLEQFSGNTLAGFGADEVAAQNMARSAVGGVNQAGSDALNTNTFLLDPRLLHPDSNPFLKAQGDAITRTTTDNLLERILPSIRGGATAAGGMYSGGQTKQGVAEGLAVGKTNQAIGDSLANLYGQAYQTGLSTLGSAVSRTPQIQASQLFGSEVLGAVGAQQRALEQATLDEAQRKFYLEQALPLLRAQDIYGFIQATPGGSGTSQVQGIMPKTNPIMGGLGGALSGAVAGNTLFPGAGGIIGGLLGGAAGFFGNR